MRKTLIVLTKVKHDDNLIAESRTPCHISLLNDLGLSFIPGEKR